MSIEHQFWRVLCLCVSHRAGRSSGCSEDRRRVVWADSLSGGERAGAGVCLGGRRRRAARSGYGWRGGPCAQVKHYTLYAKFYEVEFKESFTKTLYMVICKLIIQCFWFVFGQLCMRTFNTQVSSMWCIASCYYIYTFLFFGCKCFFQMLLPLHCNVCSW